ncbi:hypothetical protein LWF15_12410 [Kineosporia rhizophila]|uniref:YxiG-like protein n=1 Tax=Kineosporia TaxID=49184 RepID=UPI001E3C5B72|nr:MULTISPECIES: hypothetical protein [Kineosporia]MCE0536312.1 hypothetical protein [Kineosporia rhizophila]
MNADEIERALDDLFDHALVYHGYTDYMRDYELIVAVQGSAHGEAPQSYRRYLFRICPRVTVTSTVGQDVWPRSLDERLLQAAVPDGGAYAWGVRWQVLYPGAGRLETSRETRRWSSRLGVPFYEVTLEGNCHELQLLFSDLTVADLEAGYTPFVVPAGGVRA